MYSMPSTLHTVTSDQYHDCLSLSLGMAHLGILHQKRMLPTIQGKQPWLLNEQETTDFVDICGLYDDHLVSIVALLTGCNRYKRFPICHLMNPLPSTITDLAIYVRNSATACLHTKGGKGSVWAKPSCLSAYLVTFDN